MKYEGLGRRVGALVDVKNTAYGNSFNKADEFLQLLWPEGCPREQFDDMLCLVRIFDKIMRIATNRDALGESPYQDIAGYALLGLARVETEVEAKSPMEKIAAGLRKRQEEESIPEEESLPVTVVSNEHEPEWAYTWLSTKCSPEDLEIELAVTNNLPAAQREARMIEGHAVYRGKIVPGSVVKADGHIVFRARMTDLIHFWAPSATTPTHHEPRE